MAISLYDLSVGAYLQTLGAVSGVLERGLTHCKEKGVDPQEIVETRLYEDMLPFAFQIVSVAHHSAGAIEGVKKGEFNPPGRFDFDYAGLQKVVADAQASLITLTPADVNALEGGDMAFKMGDFRIPFTAEGFLMSFSMPNFYFHAATAYDILRSKGVKLGKRDFMGAMRMKTE